MNKNPKIILFNSNIKEPIAINRINEFIQRGYNLEVYYYSRSEWKNEVNDNERMHSLGVMESGAKSYLARVWRQYSDLKKLTKKYKDENVVFYFMGFDYAVFYILTRAKIPYIYEESDLRHTYFPHFLVSFFEKIDKKMIKNSMITAFTSEGFIKYHFGSYEAKPQNAVMIPNRLGVGIKDVKIKPRKAVEKDKLRVAFVGSPRFKSVYNFAKVFCERFPNYEFHFYGAPLRDGIDTLKVYSNCIFHGPFVSPQDLPSIYSEIDLVLSTYDTHFDNVKYAEPNKIYESIFFEVPIIVSSGTFLADKVNKLGIGYDVDPFDEKAIVDFINGLTVKDIDLKSENAKRIPKDSLISINDELFDKLNRILNNE